MAILRGGIPMMAFIPTNDCTVFTCAGCMRCFFQKCENNSQNDCLLEVFSNMNVIQLCIFWVAPKPYLLLFFVLIELDIVKTLPRCYLKTYIEEPDFPAENIHRQQQHPKGCSNEGHGFFHSRKNNSRCLKNIFACSGPNQANNLPNIFDMHVL